MIDRITRRDTDAIEMYERAFEAGLDDHGTSRYNLACAFARTKQIDRALENLSLAIDQGFSNRDLMDTDDDLAACRADDRFKKLRNRLAK